MLGPGLESDSAFDSTKQSIKSQYVYNILLLHTPSLNSVNYYYPRCDNIPRGRRPSGILPIPRVVINTLFNKKECATIVLLYRIGLITGVN